MLENGFDPGLIIQIPADGFADAALEGVGGRPAEIVLEFGGVNGVAAIMAGPVLDEGDEFASTAAQVRGELVHKIGDEFNDAEVGPFVMAADVVGFAVGATREDLPEGLGVVADVKPVANVHAVPVNRDWFAGEAALNDDRDELFGKLIGAVVVGAVGEDDRQAIGVVVSAHEHVAGGVAGGIGRVGRVGGGFGKEAGRTEGAIDFVGGDVVE